MKKDKKTAVGITDLIEEQGSSLLEAFDIEDVIQHLKDHGYIVDDTPIKHGFGKIRDFINEHRKELPVAAQIDLFNKIRKYLDVQEDLLVKYY